MKKVIYGFRATTGKFAGRAVLYHGTEKQSEEFYNTLIAARDYLVEHPEEKIPFGTLREAVQNVCFYIYRDDEMNINFEGVIETPQEKTERLKQEKAEQTPKPPTEPTPEPTPEQTTETTKTHKKTPDTTEKKFKRIFAELARIKEELATLQMKR